jgi:hypothetical protein
LKLLHSWEVAVCQDLLDSFLLEGGDVLVNPELLRALAGQVDSAAAVIGRADVGSKVSTSADGLASSTTQWAARTVGDHFTGVANQLAQNVTKIGTAVRGAGDRFEVADNALAGQFDGFF